MLAKDVIKLPGWRWMRGMKVVFESNDHRSLQTTWLAEPNDLRRAEHLASCGRAWPSLGDAATAGCFLALLGPVELLPTGVLRWTDGKKVYYEQSGSLARTCACLAEKIGRWPGGESL